MLITLIWLIHFGKLQENSWIGFTHHLAMSLMSNPIGNQKYQELQS